MNGFDAVLKVGGSLSRGPDLAHLGQALGRLGRHYRLLLVPGGGQFADLVRYHYQRYHLSETMAHRMALLAMDQYGCLLAELIPGSAAVQDLWSARQIADDGRLPILLPAALVLQADPLPNSWEVTSDSLAAWIAGLAGAACLVLLKDVDGLYPADALPGPPPEPYEDLDVGDLVRQPGGVDDYLAVVLMGLELETWAINGQHPERLAELLATGRTLGTCIRKRRS
jgi:aspartokinase-like uncharacterized kinase